MVSNLNTAHLSSINDKDSAAAQQATSLADNLKSLVLQSADPYIQSAMKCAGKKPFKEKPQSYLDALGMIFKAAQVTRLAILMRGLSDVSFTYEFAEGFYHNGELGSSYYKIPEKSYKRGAHQGLLSDSHNEKFVADLIVGYEKNMSIDTQGVENWVKNLRPCGGRSVLNPISSLHAQLHDLLEPVCRSKGVSGAEQRFTGDVFFKQRETVLSLCENGSDYDVKPEAIDGLQKFAEGIMLDAARLQSYLDENMHVQGDKAAALLPEIKAGLASHQATLSAEGTGLSAMLLNYTKQAKYIAAQKEKLTSFKDMVTRERYINVLKGGGYEHLVLSTSIQNTALDYINLSLECLEYEEDGVQDSALTTKRDQKKAQLEAHYQKADMINQTIAFLKAPRIAALEGAAASEFSHDTCALMDNALHLAQDCAQQIEQKFYCALKASGKYGEANLMAAFIAAAQSKEPINVTIAPQDPEKEQEQENGVVPAIEIIERPMAEKINALLKADLMMHGWDSELPEGWAAKNMPDSGVLTHYENHPYTWLSAFYQSPSPLSASEGFVEKDLTHRMGCIKNIGQYLTKAKSHVDSAAQANIEDTLALIGGQLWPKLAELQAACGFASNAENDNAPAQASAKTSRGYMPHTGG
jgi:hypothetical protein